MVKKDTEAFCTWAQEWKNLKHLPSYERALESKQKPDSRLPPLD